MEPAGPRWGLIVTNSQSVSQSVNVPHPSSPAVIFQAGQLPSRVSAVKRAGKQDEPGCCLERHT